MHVMLEIRDLCQEAQRLAAEGRREEERVVLEKAVAWARAELPTGHYGLPMTLAILSRCHAEEGATKSSLLLADEALALAAPLPETDLEHQVTILKHLVAAYRLDGEASKAEVAGDRALSLLESFHGDAHPMVALTRGEIARLGRN